MFELVLSGEATENDWDVFVEVPIRYNDELESVRLKCTGLAEEFARGRKPGFLLSEEGLVGIESLLTTLKQKTD